MKLAKVFEYTIQNGLPVLGDQLSTPILFVDAYLNEYLIGNVDVNKVSEGWLNARGIFQVEEVRPPIGEFEVHGQPSQSLLANKWRMDYTAVEVSLDQAKARKRIEIEDDFESAVELGAEVGDGISMAIKDKDQFRFETLDAHESRKGTSDTETVSFFDVSGNPRQMTYGEFKAALVLAGEHYKSLYFQKSSRMMALDQAITLGEVKAI